MGTSDWDLELIGQTLGVVGTPAKPGVIGFDLDHQAEDIRLRLEVAPNHRAVRLYCKRQHDDHALVLCRTDLFGIEEVLCDEAQGTVRFRNRRERPTDLMVSEDATFELFVAAPTPDSPGAQPPLAADGLVHLVGRLARPRFSDRTGKPFFSAGLAEYPDGGIVPIWHSLKAFEAVALQAAGLERGQMVRVSGHLRQEHFRGSTGRDQQRNVLILASIEATG